MNGKIGLEEHFAIPDTVGDSERFCFPEAWSDLRQRLLDLQQRRLDMMDKNGIEVMLLSLNAPAIQAIPNRKVAIEIAKRANDFLAEEIAKQPKRFAGLAALPMQDPDAAIAELQHAIKDLGFKGALVNSHSQVDVAESMVYYDLPQYWPFWEEVEKLEVPFYLHPRCPAESQQKMFEGHPWLLGSAWGFSVETATHALRLMGSGLFDQYPKLTVILGHLGEMLPTNIWRTSHRVTKEPGPKSLLPFSDYLHKNFYITTSGNFRLSPLLTAMIEMGSDRIMFSSDYPFEDVGHAANWFDALEIGEGERQKIGRLNAKKLFKLDFLD